jgi:putative membrane protein
MHLEALLAFLHIAAILTLVVFISSQAALCRVEWLNAAVVRRLLVLDRIYLIALALVAVSGLARTLWGIKSAAWYFGQPLWMAKFTLLLLIAVLALKPSMAFKRWNRQLDADGSLPPEAEIKTVRALIMRAAHLLLLIPVAGVMLARGLGLS